MYCEYRGLKYKIKKKNDKYIIISRVKKEGFTNYIDVLGNEHSELYMKGVKANEVDVIYDEDVFMKYKDKYFRLFADKISRKVVLQFLKLGTQDLEKVDAICTKYNMAIPTEMKLYYDVIAGKKNYISSRRSRSFICLYL